MKKAARPRAVFSGLIAVAMVACGAENTLRVSENQLAVPDAIEQGDLKESSLRNRLIESARPAIRKALAERGVKAPFNENWMVGTLGPYTLLAGSAARTRQDIYGFLFVFEKESGVVYREIGQEASGQLPDTVAAVLALHRE